MEAKKKYTKRHPMTSEEAARTLNLEHDLYLALLTEETRKNYEAAGLFDDFFRWTHSWTEVRSDRWPAIPKEKAEEEITATA